MSLKCLLLNIVVVVVVGVGVVVFVVCLCVLRLLPLVHVSIFFPFTYAFDAVYVICSSTFITLSSSDKWIDQNGYEHIVYIWQSCVFFLFYFLFNKYRSYLAVCCMLYVLVHLSNVFPSTKHCLRCCCHNNNKFVDFYEINDDLNTFFVNCYRLSVFLLHRTRFFGIHSII